MYGLKKCQHRLLFTGAANDGFLGFLLNTLKTLFRLSRVLLVFRKFILIGAIKLAIFAGQVFIRHIRLRSFAVLCAYCLYYKIHIRSVILGQLHSFRNYQGFSVIFPKILDAILNFTKVRILFIPLSIAFLNPKILGFLFLRN